jgi:hypothetical protein
MHAEKQDMLKPLSTGVPMFGKNGRITITCDLT